MEPLNLLIAKNTYKGNKNARVDYSSCIAYISFYFHHMVRVFSSIVVRVVEGL